MSNKIEETLAFQEQQISDLSDMIIAQGNAIDKLEKEVQKLQGKLEQINEDAPEANQPPPHY